MQIFKHCIRKKDVNISGIILKYGGKNKEMSIFFVLFCFYMPFVTVNSKYEKKVDIFTAPVVFK